MSQRSFPAGTFLRVHLEERLFGYARVLEKPDVAFYKFFTEEPIGDLESLEVKPLLFVLAVRLRDLDKWTPLGSRPLRGDVAKPIVSFHQKRDNFRDCTIYDSTGREWKATPEECVGLERDAVWEVNGIEERLRDVFAGRPNAQEVRLRVRLE